MSDHAHHDAAAAPHAAPAGGSPIKRLLGEMRRLPQSIKANPLRAGMVLGGLSIFAIVISIAVFYVATLDPEVAAELGYPNDTPIRALAALEAGDRTEARRIVAAITVDKEVLPDLAIPLYVLGMAMAKDAEEQWNPESKKRLFTVAGRYLEEGSKLGFPDGREAEAYYQLGYCWHGAGRYARSLPALHEALTRGTKRVKEIHELLADGYLNDRPPNYAKSREFNELLLADAEIEPASRQKGLLREAQIALSLKETDNCRKALDAVPAGTALQSDLLLIRGRLAFFEAEELGRANSADTPAKYTEALEYFRSVPPRNSTDDRPPAAAVCLQGVCLRRLGNEKDAAAVFSRVRRRYPGTSEYVLASLEEAEIMHQQKKHEPAVELLLRMLSLGTDDKEFRNDWISHEDFEKRIGDIQESLRAEHLYDTAIKLSDAAPGWIPAWQLSLWKARVYETRALETETTAATAPFSQARESLHSARSDHRRSGESYAKLAELRIATPNYIDDLWKAIEESLSGHDYEQVIRLVQRYLKVESRKRRPDALAAMGEALLCLNRLDESIAVLDECLNHHSRHPAAYRARFSVAQAYAEKGNLREAEKFLEQNIYSDDLTPRSVDWRDSLFLLGKILYRDGVEWEARSRIAGIEDDDPEKLRAGLKDLEQAHVAFRRAIEELSKAVERYPRAAQTPESRYMIGEAYRQAAKWPRNRLRIITVESTRSTLNKQIQADMIEAVANYDALIAELNDAQDSPERTQLEKNVLRNCYFAKADALFDLGRSEDAIKAYSAATNRYQHEPVSLEAYVQIAACYRQLNKPAEARGTLQQAKIVLKRMKDTTDFTQITPYTREEWTRLLDWLATR